MSFKKDINVSLIIRIITRNILIDKMKIKKIPK